MEQNQQYEDKSIYYKIYDRVTNAIAKSRLKEFKNPICTKHEYFS